MEKSFSAILEGVLQYEQKQFVIVSALVAVCLLIIVVIAIVRWGRMTLVDRIITAAIVLLLAVVYIGYTIYNANYCAEIKCDITNGDYITYKGEFVHDDYQKDSFYHNVYTVDSEGDNLMVRMPDYGNQYGLFQDYRELPLGSSVGTVVYSPRSRIIVSWRIEP